MALVCVWETILYERITTNLCLGPSLTGTGLIWISTTDHFIGHSGDSAEVRAAKVCYGCKR